MRYALQLAICKGSELRCECDGSPKHTRFTQRLARFSFCARFARTLTNRASNDVALCDLATSVENGLQPGTDTSHRLHIGHDDEAKKTGHQRQFQMD